MASITDKQWQEIRNYGLGLRSGKDEHDIEKAATYAMDIGKQGKYEPHPPSNWEKLLQGTIETILAFHNSKERYLLIVTGVAPTSEDYTDTFPKCSAKAKSVLHATKIGDQKEDALVNWVVSSIPST